MYAILLILCAIVAIILMKVLWNMSQGGSANTSQRLMRMRVLAQAIAVIAMVVFVYFSRN